MVHQHSISLRRVPRVFKIFLHFVKHGTGFQFYPITLLRQVSVASHSVILFLEAISYEIHHRPSFPRRRKSKIVNRVQEVLKPRFLREGTFSIHLLLELLCLLDSRLRGNDDWCVLSFDQPGLCPEACGHSLNDSMLSQRGCRLLLLDENEFRLSPLGKQAHSDSTKSAIPLNAAWACEGTEKHGFQ